MLRDKPLMILGGGGSGREFAIIFFLANQHELPHIPCRKVRKFFFLNFFLNGLSLTAI